MSTVTGPLPSVTRFHIACAGLPELGVRPRQDALSRREGLFSDWDGLHPSFLGKSFSSPKQYGHVAMRLCSTIGSDRLSRVY
jgi:hypothetical protein